MSLILPKRLYGITTGVLGSFAVSTVSQATRLGKGSSVTTRDERASQGSYYGEIYLERTLKHFIIISEVSFGLYPTLFSITELSFVMWEG